MNNKFLITFEKVAFNKIKALKGTFKTVKDTFKPAIKNIEGGVLPSRNIAKATNISKEIRKGSADNLARMEQKRKIANHMDKMLKAGIPKETIRARMKAHYAKKAVK